jgi:hypothetical protein
MVSYLTAPYRSQLFRSLIDRFPLIPRVAVFTFDPSRYCGGKNGGLLGSGETPTGLLANGELCSDTGDLFDFFYSI